MITILYFLTIDICKTFVIDILHLKTVELLLNLILEIFMSVKNDCISTLRGDFTASCRICPLEVSPGKQIRESLEIIDKNKQRIFQLFLRKVPQAQDIILQLTPDHISEVHLPLMMSAIFMIFLEDRVEDYQSQLDVRDATLDDQWENLRMRYAVERSKLFVSEDSPFRLFLADLTKRLKEENCLADFEKTADLFLQIMRIDHMGSARLAALFVKKEDPTFSKVKGSNDVVIQVSRASLERLYHVMVQQFQKHTKWTLSKLKETALALNDSSFRKLLQDTQSKNAQSSREEVDIVFQKVEEAQINLLHMMLASDLSDNEAISKHMKNLEFMLKCGESIKQCLCGTINSCAALGVSFKDPSIRKITEELFASRLDPQLNEEERNQSLQKSIAVFDQVIQNTERGSSVLNCYIIEPVSEMISILSMLFDSNKAIEEAQTCGTKLALAKNLPPILISQKPPVQDQVSIDLEWMETGKNKRRKHNGNRQATQQNGNRQATQQKSNPSENKTSSKGAANHAAKTSAPGEKAASSQTATPPVSPVSPAVLDPFEQLKFKLLHLHDAEPSPILRQVIWHADALKCVQDAYGKSPISSQDYVNYIDTVASGSQKLLELTYRFCLEKKGNPLKVHNLKQAHRALFSSSSYPEIVEELSQANHFTRYFHFYYEEMHSRTTSQVTISPLLQLLVSAAKRPETLKQETLQKWAEETVQKGTSQALLLLKSFSDPKGSPFIIPDVALTVSEPIKIDKFQNIFDQLKAFLTEKRLVSYHPSALKIKQALSSLTMLKASIEQLNGTQYQHSLASWMAWSLFQLQETVENVLHAIEFFKETEITYIHELKDLAGKLDLEMGTLSEDLRDLSYKPRYPAEHLPEGMSARLIDDAEALRQYPELLEGAKLSGRPRLLWKLPSSDVSIPSLFGRLTSLLEKTAVFLQVDAISALQTSWETRFSN